MSLLLVCCTKDDEAKAATVQMAGKHVALIVSSHSSGISGVVAHSRYFSEYAFEKMTGKNPDGKSMTIGNKELMIIPDAVHTDLYDDKNGKIPYDKMEEFFRENMK